MGLEFCHGVLHGHAGIEEGDVAGHDIGSAGFAGGFWNHVHRVLDFLREMVLLCGATEEGIERADAFGEGLEGLSINGD